MIDEKAGVFRMIVKTLFVRTKRVQTFRRDDVGL